jgi:DNA repair protein RadC
MGWWRFRDKAGQPEGEWIPMAMPKDAAPVKRPGEDGGFATGGMQAGGSRGFRESMDRASAFVGLRSARPEATPAGAMDEGQATVVPFSSEGPDGHRERMRDRLLDRGPDGLADYELVEMVLFLAQPKGDTKPIAKRVINRFGSYAATIAAEPRDLAKVPGVGRHSVAALKLVHASAIRLTQSQVKIGPVLGNWDQLMGYLNAILVHERIEQFRILFLDTKNHLLADEQQGRGTVNHTPVYPREVARRALELHAAAIILVHNHPSGDPQPSGADIEMTMQIESALKTVAVLLHDHVIVGNGTWLSLKKEGLL